MKAVEVITTQTEKALEGLTEKQVENTIIAYEPIWAIKQGKLRQVKMQIMLLSLFVIKFVKSMDKMWWKSIIIQYGGSVKSTNCKELFTTSDIDGGLVGGASLDSEEFAKIVNYNKYFEFNIKKDGANGKKSKYANDIRWSEIILIKMEML